MCGSEVKPKTSGLTEAALSLLKQAQRVQAGVGLTANTPVPSPCSSVCHMSPDTGWCAGCWRSLDEIGHWGQSSNESKQQVWARIAQRLTAHTG
jgi:predicted Fe-S protein YdhL (DUF1289 family)